MLAGFASISVDRRTKGDNFRHASDTRRAHCGQVCPEQGVLRPSAAAPDGDSRVGNGGREWLNDKALALLDIHKGAVGAAFLTVEGVSAPHLWWTIQLSQAKPGHHRAEPRQQNTLCSGAFGSPSAWSGVGCRLQHDREPTAPASATSSQRADQGQMHLSVGVEVHGSLRADHIALLEPPGCTTKSTLSPLASHVGHQNQHGSLSGSWL